MSDWNSPPIFLSFSNPFVPLLDDAEENRRTFITILIVFLVLMFLYFARIPLWRFVTRRVPYLAPDHERYIQEEANAEQNAQRFIANFHSICWSMASISFSIRDIRDKPSKLLPWVFIALWIISIILLHYAIGTRNVISEYNSKPIIREHLAQAGLILFFISVNGYLIDRIMSYYKDKTDYRKKAEFANGARGSAIDSVSLQRIQHPRGPRPMSMHSQDLVSSHQNDPVMSSTQTEMLDHFDRFFNYRRRIKHLRPQFNRIRFTFMNAIQILILFTEFIQLASFPFRDLLRNEHFQNAILLSRDNGGISFVNSIRSITSTISSGLPAVHTRFLANIQFAFAWWLVIVGSGLAVIFMTSFYLLKLEWIENSVSPKALHILKKIVGGPWILSCLPLINLLYLVILSAFIDPLGCISDNTTPLWPAPSRDLVAVAEQNRILQCLPIRDGNPAMHTGYALSGFMILSDAHIRSFWGQNILFFRTAQEPVPTDGQIHYTSRSELIYKNASLILLLLYILIPTSGTSTVRGVLAIFILTGMIVYNNFIGCSYTRIVNFIRTISFLWVLWMCAVVVFYTHPANADFTENSGTQVFTVIGVGWALLFVLHSMLYIFLIRNYQEESQQPRQPRSRQSSLANFEPIGTIDSSSNTMMINIDNRSTSIAPIVLKDNNKLMFSTTSMNEGDTPSSSMSTFPLHLIPGNSSQSSVNRLSNMNYIDEHQEHLTLEISRASSATSSVATATSPTRRTSPRKGGITSVIKGVESKKAIKSGKK